MRDAWQFGHLFGIPLRIHVSWLIVFGLVSWSLAAGYFPAQLPDLPVWSYWTKAIIAAAMFFASLILHELGHSLVARRHGVGIASITLFVFGGVSEIREEPRTPRQEFEIAVIGPAVSFALAGLFAVIGFLTGGDGTPTGINVVVLYLASVNLLVAIFNLLPAFPLDGGRVRHQPRLSPAAYASGIQDVQAIRIFPGSLRNVEPRRRPDILGRDASRAPSALGSGG